MIRLTKIVLFTVTIALICPAGGLAQDRKGGKTKPATRAGAKKAKPKSKTRTKRSKKKGTPVLPIKSKVITTESGSGSGSGSGAGAGTPEAAPKGDSLPSEPEYNECLKKPRKYRFKLDLKKGVELNELVELVSKFTCKRFIVPDTLRAQKVTILSPKPITPSELYRAFLSMLDVMGLTVTPAGRYLKVVQSNWAIQAPIPTYTHKQRRRIPNNDSVVTQMLQVEHTDVNNLLLVLNKMKSRSGDITAYKPSNMLIITDVAANVRRLVRIVSHLDIPSEGEKIWVVRLKKADPQDVSKILTQVFGKQRGAAPRRPIGRTRPKQDDIANYSASKIVNDEASNSLIIVATAAAFAKIYSLIKKLDVESQGVNQKVHVYYLENADAEDMNTTLSNLTSGRRGRTRGRGRARKGQRRGAVSATLFEGDVKISADKATNSLVIVATNKDFLNLRRVIRKLDIPRRQVFVEATILEVTLDKNREMGFTYHGGGPTGSGDTESFIFGGVQFPPEWSSVMLNPLGMMGLAAGVRGAEIEGSGKLSGFGTDLPGFGVMFKAFQANNNVHILSSPHILTTDNEKAEILVGTNLPFQGSMMGGMPMMGGTGQNQQASQMAAMFGGGISVQRQDVALKLKLTPHVNDSDMVRLKIEQEIQGVVSKNYNNLGPATSKRSAKTTVVVRDQQTVVIGGLMGNNIRNTSSKVPLLGDIPLLGYFFKYNKSTVERTNLLIVLTPYVIRDQSDLRRIFKRKLEERREFIERYTSFKPGEVSADIDYRHKRGLLAEINIVSRQAEQEAKILKKAKEETEDAVTPVEMPKGMSPAPGQPNGRPKIEQQPHRRASPPASPVRIHPTRSGTIHLR